MSDEPRHNEAAERWQEAVTRRVRALIRTGPLHAAERGKGRRDVDLARVDLRSLALRVLDVVIEEMGLGGGATRDDAGQALDTMVSEMDSTLTGAERENVAQAVIDALLNEGDRRQAFRTRYLDWVGPEPVARELQFHLLREVELPDGTWALRATTEGINVYTGMLEVDVQDAQVAEEAVLHAQIRRGRIRDAMRTAQNARLRSIEYHETLRRVLRLVERDVAQVEWSRDIGEVLTNARLHLGERLEAESQLVQLAGSRMDGASAEDAPRLAELIDILEECQGRHYGLHGDVMRAAERFLREQDRQRFRPRARTRLPDLEAEVMQPAMDLPARALSDMTPLLLRHLIPAASPSLVYLPQLVDRLLAPPRRPAQMDAVLDEVELEDVEAVGPWFSEDDEAQVSDLLTDLDPGGEPLGALLRRLRAAGGSAQAEELLVLLALRAFDPAAGDAHGARSLAEDNPLMDQRFSGDELLLVPYTSREEGARLRRAGGDVHTPHLASHTGREDGGGR